MRQPHPPSFLSLHLLSISSSILITPCHFRSHASFAHWLRNQRLLSKLCTSYGRLDKSLLQVRVTVLVECHLYLLSTVIGTGRYRRRIFPRSGKRSLRHESTSVNNGSDLGDAELISLPSPIIIRIWEASRSTGRQYRASHLLKVGPRLCENEMKKLRSPTCSR